MRKIPVYSPRIFIDQIVLSGFGANRDLFQPVMGHFHFDITALLADLEPPMASKIFLFIDYSENIIVDR